MLTVANLIRLLGVARISLAAPAHYWAYTQLSGGHSKYDGGGRSPEAKNTFNFVSNLMF